MNRQCNHFVKKMIECKKCHILGCEKCMLKAHKGHYYRHVDVYKKIIKRTKYQQRGHVYLFLTNFNKIYAHYIAKGTKEVWLYHPIYNKFKKLEITCMFPKHCSSIILQNKIYLIGGILNSVVSDNSYYIDFILKKLISICPLPVAKDDASLCKYYDDAILCIGGKNVKSLSNCEIYNPIIDKWKSLPLLNIRRHCSGVCCFREGWAYAFGGCTDEFNCGVKEIEKCNFTTDGSWIIVALVDNIGVDIAGFPLSSTEILIVGGYCNGKVSADSKLLNILVDSVSINEGKCIIQPAMFYRTSAPFYVEKHIYFISDEGNMHIFDTSNSSWSLLTNEAWKKKTRKSSQA